MQARNPHEVNDRRDDVACDMQTRSQSSDGTGSIIM